MTDPVGGNRTVFRPSPLQGLKAAAPAAAVPSPTEPRAPGGARTTGNVIMREAAPLLALVAGMRSGRVRLPLAQLHRTAVEAIGRAGTAIADAHDPDTARRATDALAATVDDLAANLPGLDGEQAEWRRRSLAERFGGGPAAGDRLWAAIDAAGSSPAPHRDLIELYHACLAAGFGDRHRSAPDGRDRLRATMARLHAAMGEAATGDLSPHWRGEQAPAARAGGRRYALLAAAATAAMLLVIYVTLRLLLLGSAGAPAAALAAINPEAPLHLSRGAR